MAKATTATTTTAGAAAGKGKAAAGAAVGKGKGKAAGAPRVPPMNPKKARAPKPKKSPDVLAKERKERAALEARIIAERKEALEAEGEVYKQKNGDKQLLNSSGVLKALRLVGSTRTHRRAKERITMYATECLERLVDRACVLATHRDAKTITMADAINAASEFDNVRVIV